MTARAKSAPESRDRGPWGSDGSTEWGKVGFSPLVMQIWSAAAYLNTDLGSAENSNLQHPLSDFEKMWRHTFLTGIVAYTPLKIQHPHNSLRKARPCPWFFNTMAITDNISQLYDLTTIQWLLQEIAFPIVVHVQMHNWIVFLVPVGWLKTTKWPMRDLGERDVHLPFLVRVTKWLEGSQCYHFFSFQIQFLELQAACSRFWKHAVWGDYK